MSVQKTESEILENRLSWRRGCIIAFAVIAVFMGLYVWMFFSDVQPTDDSDLRLPTAPDLPDEENGAYWWGKAMAELEEEPDVEVLSTTEWFGDFSLSRADIGDDVEALEAFVRANRTRFAALERAATCERIVQSIDQEHWESSFLLGDLAVAGAQSAWLRGEPERAVELLRCHRSIRQRAGPLSWVWFPQSVILAWSHLIQEEEDPQVLRTWLGWFEDPILAEDWASDYVRAMYENWRIELVDRERAKGWLEVSDNPLARELLFFRQGRTIEKFAAQVRNLRDQAARGERLESYETPSGFQRILWFLGGNLSGEELVHYLLDDSGTYQEAADSTRVADALLRTAIALRIDRLERGAYPTTLDELVPRVLAEIPRDPRDPRGGAIRWDAQRRVLWSIGSGGVDQGGRVTHPGGNLLDLDSQIGGDERTLELP